MLNVYGLKSCDTCGKALKWLRSEGIEHRFHDLRGGGVTEGDIARWADELGWAALLNRRGTTWRNLDDAAKAGLDDTNALRLLSCHRALIKRPVFDLGDRRLLGFDAPVRDELQRNAR